MTESAPDARINTELPNHHKTKRLIRRLGDSGAWAWVKLICWAAANKPTGDLGAMTAEDIEISIDWNGEPGAFVQALIESRLLDQAAPGRYQLHDWQDHQPYAFGARERTLKSKWAALCKHHGPEEADRRLPEYARIRAKRAKNPASGSEKAASGTENPATGSENPASGTEKGCHGQIREENVTVPVARKKAASGSQNPCPGHAQTPKSPAPSPSPSPSPLPSAVGNTSASTLDLTTRARTPGTPEFRAQVTDACKRMIRAGCPSARVNPTHVQLLKAIEAGVTPEELEACVIEAVASGKQHPFTYAISMAHGRRTEASATPTEEPRHDQRPARSAIERASESVHKRRKGNLATGPDG